MRKKFKLNQKMIALILTIIIAVASFLPAKPARADPDIITELFTGLTSAYTMVSKLYNEVSSYAEDSLWLKEYVLDPLAWAVAKGLLQNMTDSTVKWINSGFQGSPAFVQNPEKFFRSIGDNIAGNFIAGPGSPL